MRTLAKYVVLSGAALALAWASITFEVAGRTPYDHFMSNGGKTWIAEVEAAAESAWEDAKARFEAWRAGDGEAETARKRPAQSAPKANEPERSAAVQESKGASRRVALLEAAEKEAAPKTSGREAKKAPVDAPMTASDRAALDRLVGAK